ncbi:hypothetical protein CK203_097284 [Vitis vinifera]|uniref:Uncharacterized protein n=1 Tax=Vitis vinifera TaxID=29760 RepID=A0A438D5J9_VITVI|nr:hypothetical protein CK203_097284 [Vitis vinifera]
MGESSRSTGYNNDDAKITSMRHSNQSPPVALRSTKHGVGSDPELLQAVHDVFAKLDPTIESLGQFGNELVFFRDAKRGFGDRAAIVARSTMVPGESL